MNFTNRQTTISTGVTLDRVPGGSRRGAAGGFVFRLLATVIWRAVK